MNNVSLNNWRQEMPEDIKALDSYLKDIQKQRKKAKKEEDREVLELKEILAQSALTAKMLQC